MEQLIRFLSGVEPILDVHQQLMRQHLDVVNLKKGENFYEVGKVCHRIGFVTEGVLRVVYHDDNGNEYTRYFINEQHFAVDLDSYSNKVPSKEYQEALTDCKIIVMSRNAMELFNEKIPNFSKIIHMLTEKALLEKYKIKSEMISDDAITRYSKLMQRNPNIIQRVPLGYISSFLGVSPHTLSRIRKQYK